MNDYRKIMVLIPTLNPTHELIAYIQNLTDAGFTNILIVNDGSNASCDSIFTQIETNSCCHVLKHAVNLGKGRALKNGINYYLNLPDSNQGNGIVCVDSDGQHTVDDVIKIAKSITEHPHALTLGTRSFSNSNSSDIPWKSMLGNRTTTTVFKLLFGKKISDTQTGLRGIPRLILPKFIDLKGERFDYETSMLIHAVKNSIEIIEQPIKTIYIDNNAETHFHPIRDSYKIYLLMFSVFFKYTIASLSSFIIDILLFQIILFLCGSFELSARITIATVIARICSSLYNYFVNKNLVFDQKDSSHTTIIKYYALCIFQTACSAGLVTMLYRSIQIPETIIKTVVDTLLFLASFQIQQHWVFKKK